MDSTAFMDTIMGLHLSVLSSNDRDKDTLGKVGKWEKEQLQKKMMIMLEKMCVHKCLLSEYGSPRESRLVPELWYERQYLSVHLFPPGKNQSTAPIINGETC